MIRSALLGISACLRRIETACCIYFPPSTQHSSGEQVLYPIVRPITPPWSKQTASPAGEAVCTLVYPYDGMVGVTLGGGPEGGGGTAVCPGMGWLGGDWPAEGGAMRSNVTVSNRVPVKRAVICSGQPRAQSPPRVVRWSTTAAVLPCTLTGDSNTSLTRCVSCPCHQVVMALFPCHVRPSTCSTADAAKSLDTALKRCALLAARS